MEYYIAPEYPSLRISEAQAQQFITRLAKTFKSSEKFIKQYQRNNTVYDVHIQDGKPSSYKVYQKTIQKVIHKRQLVEITYTKEKLPIYAFPSSNDHHSVVYIHRIAFRKNSHIFANVDAVLDGDEIYYMCYVSVNIDSNSDIEFLRQEIKPVLNHLTITSLQPQSVATS
jgi:hypothetical protein